MKRVIRVCALFVDIMFVWVLNSPLWLCIVINYNHKIRSVALTKGFVILSIMIIFGIVWETLSFIIKPFQVASISLSGGYANPASAAVAFREFKSHIEMSCSLFGFNI